MRYRGAVNYYVNLPSNPTPGDVWVVRYQGSSGTIPNGHAYCWEEAPVSSEKTYIGDIPAYTQLINYRPEIANWLKSKEQMGLSWAACTIGDGAIFFTPSNINDTTQRNYGNFLYPLIFKDNDNNALWIRKSNSSNVTNNHNKDSYAFNFRHYRVSDGYWLSTAYYDDNTAGTNYWSYLGSEDITKRVTINGVAYNCLNVLTSSITSLPYEGTRDTSFRVFKQAPGAIFIEYNTNTGTPLPTNFVSNKLLFNANGEIVQPGTSTYTYAYAGAEMEVQWVDLGNIGGNLPSNKGVIYYNGICYSSGGGDSGDFMNRVEPRGMGNFIISDSTHTTVIEDLSQTEHTIHNNVYFLEDESNISIKSRKFEESDYYYGDDYANFIFGKIDLKAQFLYKNFMGGDIFIKDATLINEETIYQNILLGKVKVNNITPDNIDINTIRFENNVIMASGSSGCTFKCSESATTRDIEDCVVIGNYQSITGSYSDRYHILIGTNNEIDTRDVSDSSYISPTYNYPYNESCIILGRYNSILGGSSQTIHDMCIGTFNEISKNALSYGNAAVGYQNLIHNVNYGFCFGYGNTVGRSDDPFTNNGYSACFGLYLTTDSFSYKNFLYGYGNSLLNTIYSEALGEYNSVDTGNYIYIVGDNNNVNLIEYSYIFGRANQLKGLTRNYYLNESNIYLIGTNNQIEQVGYQQNSLPLSMNKINTINSYDEYKEWYNSDDLVFYNSKIYKCINGIDYSEQGVGPFDPDNWEEYSSEDYISKSKNIYILGSNADYYFDEYGNFTSKYIDLYIENSLILGCLNEYIYPTFSIGETLINKDNQFIYYNAVNTNSAVVGYENQIGGVSYCFGHNNYIAVENEESYTFGANNLINYGNSLTFGVGISSATQGNSIRLGFYPQETVGDFFELGNGSSNTNRSTIIRIDSLGNIYLNSTVPTPPIPTTDGDYKLHIENGTATWVLLS